jgi:hypothetical protein
MKRGFLNRETPEENRGVGPLQDQRSLYSNGQDDAVRESRVPQGVRSQPLDPIATLRPSGWPEDLPAISISDARKYGNASDWDLPAVKKSKAEADVDDAMDTEKTNTWTSEAKPSFVAVTENEERPNPFKGVIFTPTALRTPPRHELGLLYAKEMKFILKDESFFTWPSKELKGENAATLFTAMFVCPLTLERYPAGRFKDYKVDSNGTAWYTRKKMAVDGVSARVYSCWYHRKGGEGTKVGDDIPYLHGEGPALPTLPADVQEKVERQVEIFKAEAVARVQQEKESVQHMEEEAVGQEEEELGRLAYRDQRLE